MDVTPRLAAGAQRVESYGPAGFRIGGVEYTGSVLISPGGTQPWTATQASDITAESLAPLLDGDIELLLIGTGARHEMVAPGLRAALKAKHIGLDSMDSGAAARTFNILLAEGRKVAAALLSIG